ncbi:MAG: hypothetical protein ACR2MD_05270 [Aridibacter sp.]|jgi:hypothetical protein
MLERDEKIKSFLELCENSSFSHREELIRGIEADEYLFESYSNSEAPSKQLLNIYTVRAKIVAEKNGNHAKRLKDDILKFTSELKKTPDEKVKSWHFSINESSSYLAFEGINSKKILGCFLIIDKRKVSESEWKNLWSK